MQMTNRPPPGAKRLRMQEGAICLRWTGQCCAGEDWSEREGSVSAGVTVCLTQLGLGWTCSLACTGARQLSTSSPGRSGTSIHGHLESSVGTLARPALGALRSCLAHWAQKEGWTPAPPATASE